MASSRIKGITVEIGGDTVGLQNALKDVNKRSNDLALELKDVERLLKFNPGNVEALAQKQQLLTQRIEATTEKLNQLRAAEQQVQAQFERGDISAEQYRAFRRELEYTQGSLGGLQNQLRNMRDEQERASRSTRELNAFFDATGTSVEHFASILGGRLTTAIRQGTATSAQLDDAIERIGRALSSIDDGNSIQNIRNELRELSREAERTEQNFKELDIGLENLLGGMVAGGGIAGTIEQALDMSKLKTKIDITFEVPESSKKSVEEAVRGVTAYGVDAESALEGVRRQWALNKNVSDEANASIVKGAAAIATAYAGIDFNELIQESNEMASELGITSDTALGLTNALLKIGFPPEQLDIIAEYGGQLTRAGYNAEEVQAIMEAGVETGTWNIDNLLDGLKEGRIKAAEFGQGVDKAMQEAIKGTNISAEQLQKWGQSVAKGGKEGSAAMTEIAKALVSIEDETKRNEIGVKLFGTMYEDQGQNITNTLIDAQEKVVDFGKNQDQLNESIKKMDANPAVKFQKAMEDLKIALEPVLSVVADLVAKFAEWVTNNPTLAATLAVVATAIGIIAGAAMALAPIVITITSISAAMLGWIVIIPIIIAAVVGLVIAIVKNWNDFKQWTIDAWNAIKEFLIGIWNGIVQTLSETWNSISETTMNVWTAISEFFIGIWNGIVAFIMPILQSISDFFVMIWTSISEFFMSTWNGIVAFLTPILQGIADFFSMIWNGISTVIQSVWNFISQYLQAIWTAILYFATPIFEGIKNFISSCWKAISSTTSAVWNGIKSILSTCWNGLVSFVMPIFKGIKDFIVYVWNTISSTTSTIWNTIKNVLSSIWSAIVSVVTPIFNNIKSAISTVWNAISSTSSSVWNGIKSTLSGIWEGIKYTASSIWSGLTEAIMTPVRWVTNAVSNAFYGMRSVVLGVWDGIKYGIKAAINGIIWMINRFIAGFNTPANLLNKIPGVNAPTIPYIPMLATGGHVLGDGQFIAGEKGPELFTKRGNSVSVTPLSSSEKSLGITGTMNQLTSDMSRMMTSSMNQLSGLKSVMSNVYGSMSNSRQAMTNSVSNQVVNYPSGSSGGGVIPMLGGDLIVEVPVNLEGRDVARGTYRYTTEYQKRDEERNSAF
ncbi:DUF2207 domain-containing protein [Bacillus cereus]|nr:DUF2207 domain-containing protein [Bacillus cereus]